MDVKISKDEINALIDWNRANMKSCASSELYVDAQMYKDRVKELVMLRDRMAPISAVAKAV